MDTALLFLVWGAVGHHLNGSRCFLGIVHSPCVPCSSRASVSLFLSLLPHLSLTSTPLLLIYCISSRSLSKGISQWSKVRWSCINMPRPLWRPQGGVEQGGMPEIRYTAKADVYCSCCIQNGVNGRSPERSLPTQFSGHASNVPTPRTGQFLARVRLDTLSVSQHSRDYLRRHGGSVVGKHPYQFLLANLVTLHH